MKHQSCSMNRRHFLGLSTAALSSAVLCVGKPDVPIGAGMVGMDDKECPFTFIRTSEFFGDDLMRLSFPRGWQLSICKMQGHDAPHLSDEQIRQSLYNTLGTDGITRLARGKQNVVITFDDCARPTPTNRVVPFILEELHAAGVSDKNIFFHASYGSHSAMSQMDMTAKLGKDIVARYPTWNHDCFNGVKSVGTTSDGMPVKLSKRFLDADLKICVSGIKPHGMVGYGGGAKAIVPGVASIETIGHVHNILDKKYQTAIGFVNNGVRLQMEEAARLAGLDMSVNIVMNGNREVAGVFAGDFVTAHRAAVKVAHPLYHTEIPQNMDVVISNAYPQSVEAGKEFKYCSMSLREGGSAVLIQDTPAGQRKIHYIGWQEDVERRGLKMPGIKGLPVPQAGQVIIFNRWPSKWDELEYSDNVYYARTWDEVILKLGQVHKEGTQVALYPYAALQHQPIELKV